MNAWEKILGYLFNVNAYKTFKNKYRRKHCFKDINSFISKESVFVIKAISIKDIKMSNLCYLDKLHRKRL